MTRPGQLIDDQHRRIGSFATHTAETCRNCGKLAEFYLPVSPGPIPLCRTCAGKDDPLPERGTPCPTCGLPTTGRCLVCAADAL